jgi:hypothetical protein
MGLQLPKEAWLAGKGPSLDGYDWTKAGWLRVGLNQTAIFIPKVYAASALDHTIFQFYKDNLDPHVLVFKKFGVPVHFDYEYTWKLGQEVKTRGASAASTVQVLHHLGVSKIHMIGFDSIDGNGNYADCILSKGWHGNCRDNYKAINDILLRVIGDLRLRIVWEHR